MSLRKSLDFLTRNPAAYRLAPAPTARVHCVAQLRLKRQILNPDGSVAKDTDWQNNLILDQGLDGVFASSWARATEYGHIGTGTDPFFRDSGATTVSVASGTATASSGFFEAGDVGRLLKLDSGEEGYITGFTSTTIVAVSMVDAASSEATVWYVDRTALQTETKRTNSLRTSGGDNGTTYQTSPARQFVYKRSHLFAVEVGSVTYTEVGWGRVNSGALFSGVILSGGGDSLVAGQQYLLISELTMTPTPTESTTAPDVATGGWSTEGDICMESIGSFQSGGVQNFSSVGTTGTIFGENPAAPFEPSWIQNPAGIAITTDFTLTTPSSTSAQTGATQVNANTVTPASYSAGNFFRDCLFVWNVSTANTAWRGVGIGGGDSNRGLTVKFDSNQTKDNVHEVRATFRISAGRVLVN